MKRELIGLVLPATLAVTTFAFATACSVTSPSEDSTSGGCGDKQMAVCADSLCSWSFAQDMCLPAYCVDIEDMTLCTEEPGCAWLDAVNHCENVCAEIGDQAACEAIDRCDWGDGLDGDGSGETGGEPTCHEPFT